MGWPLADCEVMAGTRIGLVVEGPDAEPYELRSYLGEGAFGEVYTAVGTETGKVVAVKLLQLQVGDADPILRDALLNEARLATQVVHPNVVRVLYVHEGGGDRDPYVVMEYVPDGTLASLLRRHEASGESVPLERSLEMIIDIVQGAGAIAQRLIHRDIKPDNILVDGRRLKIGDFGLSKVVDARTRTKTFKGTQHIRYIAPEVLQGATNSTKIDVYSVGLVAYEILTLRHAYDSAVIDPEDWQQWRSAHLFVAPPDVRSIRPEISGRIAQLIQRMLAKRPQDRPDWDELLHRLLETDEAALPNPLAAVVETAIKQHNAVEAQRLANQMKAERERERADFYKYSCSKVLAKVQAVIDSFNCQFQFGQIIASPSPQGNSVLYTLPQGQKFRCQLFDPTAEDIRVRGGRLFGGGYIGPVSDKVGGANLLLIRADEDDACGDWIGCVMTLNSVMGRPDRYRSRGLPSNWSGNYGETFGFENPAHFYEHIRKTAMMYAFKFQFHDDLDALFVETLQHALG
jgi:eukaryotic-like serine/threonine-protein kinase